MRVEVSICWVICSRKWSGTKRFSQMSTRTEADLGYSASAGKLQIFSADPNKTENDTLEDYYLIMQKNVTADMLSSMLSLRFNMLEVLLLASPECK